MIITKIESHTKNRYNVYIDGVFAFRAYASDLKTLQVEEEQMVQQATLCEFYEEVLTKRAKKKAMDLLVKQARCEGELIRKLTECGYPKEVVSAAISYVSGFGYLNDERYVINYLRSNTKKSKKQIEYELTQKGVESDLISNAFQEFQDEVRELHDTEDDFETISIKDIIRKKISNKHIIKEEMEPSVYYKEIQKIKMYLYRKGYPGDKIQKAMNDITSFSESILD